MEPWAVIVDERRSLLATFEELSHEQWEAASLCGAWTVRQVLGHLVVAADPPLKGYTVGVLRARGNFDKVNHQLAVDEAARPVDELLRRYEAVIEKRFAPPGWPTAAPLGDILLHSLDVRIPLGLETARPPERYVPAMELVLGRFGRAFSPKQRPPVRWVASDVAWSKGDGDEVRGAVADLALAASGRPVHLDRLEGAGVQRLRTWLA